MLSLRLPDEQLARIDALARANGMTRSQWLRDVVKKALADDCARLDPYRHYLKIMAELEATGAVLGSGESELGSSHSARIKEKLRASRLR